MGIGPFHIEGKSRLRIDEEDVAAHDDLLEVARVACLQRVEETLVGKRVHFSEAVVGQAFRVIAHSIGIEFLIAVVAVLRDGHPEFFHRSCHTELQSAPSP